MNDIVEFERVYMIDEYNLIIKRMKIYGRYMNYCYLTYEVKQLFLAGLVMKKTERDTLFQIQWKC